MTRERELTVKELAEKERVTERTVRKWIEKGAIHVRRTPGGGIRITDPHMNNQEHTGSSSR